MTIFSRAGKKIDFPKNRLIDSPEEKNRFKIDFSIFSIFPLFNHCLIKNSEIVKFIYALSGQTLIRLFPLTSNTKRAYVFRIVFSRLYSWGGFTYFMNKSNFMVSELL